MRSMKTMSDVRFLNSTVEIDNKSGNRKLEIFYEKTHADGSQMVHNYTGRIEDPEKDYSIELQDQIRRFSQKYIYKSNDDDLVQGILNILIEFDDAPQLCHDKTVIVFKNRMSEAKAELSRIEEKYYNLYKINLQQFGRMRRRGLYSMNTNRKIASISKNQSPINLNGSNQPPNMILDHAETGVVDPV